MSHTAFERSAAPGSSVFERVVLPLERRLTRHAVPLLQLSLGVVFLWFGALKLFPGLSPAESLAARTVALLSFGLLPQPTSMIALALLECAIGLGLILGKYLRSTLALLLLQMIGASSPLFLLPHETFVHFPYAPTLEGQYILKNLVLVSAALVLGAIRRGDWVARQRPAALALLPESGRRTLAPAFASAGALANARRRGGPRGRH